jgi:cytochrome c-type biogenesis protein CcmH/NrfG
MNTTEPRTAGGRTNAPQAPAAWQLGLALALLLPALAWVLWEGQRVLRADLNAMGPRKHVAVWASGQALPKTADEWQEAFDALSRAQQITPDNPGLFETMGDLHVVAGQRDWDDEALRHQHFGRAVEQYTQSLALRPGEAQTWAALASAYSAMGERGAPMQDAWKRALALGPNEGHVQLMLLQTALEIWAEAPAFMTDWASALFDRADSGGQRNINDMAKRYDLQFVVSDTTKRP